VPTRLLTVLCALTLGAVVLQTSVFANNVANGGTAGASGGPPASGAPAGSGGPPASGAPPSGPAADVTIEAQGIKYLEASVTAPAGKPFTIAFHNEDAGTPHNVELQDGSGKVVFRGDVFNGVETRVYDVPAQPAGEYKFSCTVHPTMTGTATLQ
jgi:plastocyanin